MSIWQLHRLSRFLIAMSVTFPQPPFRTLLGVLTAGSALIASNLACAAPDAGTQIRRYQEETLLRLNAQSREDQAAVPETPSRSAQAAATSQERIHVAAFLVHGVTRFSNEQIASALRPFVGQDLDTKGIHQAADTLNRLYREAGFFAAKVFIPPQDVAGTIRLDVYEGYLDPRQGIEVVNKGNRVDSQVIEGILSANIKADQPIHRADYERALLIAEDLPGVTTASALYPGETVGTARLRTTLNDLPLIEGNIDVDNFGTKAIGEYRLGTTLYLNSPTRVGDQAVARLVTSGDRSNYAYLTYLRPVSAYGTRLGASVDYFTYNADRISNLGYSDGQATDLRLYLTHPIIRSRHNNLNLRTDLSQLDIADHNDLGIN